MKHNRAESEVTSLVVQTLFHIKIHRFHPLNQHGKAPQSTVKFHTIYPIHFRTMNSASRWIKEHFPFYHNTACKPPYEI